VGRASARITNPRQLVLKKLLRNDIFGRYFRSFSEERPLDSARGDVRRGTGTDYKSAPTGFIEGVEKLHFSKEFQEFFSKSGELGEESARITNPRQLVLKSCWE
jgi:hypothetical protein